MRSEPFENKGQHFIENVRLALIGANATFAALSLANSPNNPSPLFPGTYGVFPLITIANLYPMALLLLAKQLRRLDVRYRVRRIFTFLGLEWLAFFGLGFEIAKHSAASLPGVMMPILIIGGLILLGWGLVCWRLRREIESPEGMFP